MAEKNSTKKTVKDLTAGTAGGILQVTDYFRLILSDVLLRRWFESRCYATRSRYLSDNRLTSLKWYVFTSLSECMSRCVNLDTWVFDVLKRMQTSPAGTYSGMLHCAGGILKNEGPLAFYKVKLICNTTFMFLDYIYQRAVFVRLGNRLATGRYRVMCIHPIRCFGVHEACLSPNEYQIRSRRARWETTFRRSTCVCRFCCRSGQ